MSLVRRIARTSLAGIFVIQGLDGLLHPGGKVPAAAPLLDRLIPVLHLPDDKELLVRANSATMVTGGILLATGFLPRVGGAMVAATMVPTTLAGHAFWSEKDPVKRKQQRIHFLKNLGLFGGGLLAALDTAGKPGLAWRAQDLASRSRREAEHAVHTTRREARIARQGAQLKVQDALG